MMAYWVTTRKRKINAVVKIRTIPANILYKNSDADLKEYVMTVLFGAIQCDNLLNILNFYISKNITLERISHRHGLCEIRIPFSSIIECYIAAKCLSS